MIATKNEYRQALLKGLRDGGHLRTTKYLDLLKAQYAAENHTSTATRMAEAVGYENYNAANLQYGTMAKIIADAMGYVTSKRADAEPKW